MVDPVVSVVNTVRSRALIRSHLKFLAKDLETEHVDVLYYNTVAQFWQSAEASIGLMQRNSLSPYENNCI